MDELMQLRHLIHKHPEISGEEKNTKAQIIAFFDQLPDCKTIDLNAAGVAFRFFGKKEGKHCLVRCELDALPIKETENKPYSSVFENVAHLCGHDGHMAIVCGVGKWLSEHSIQAGIVTLLFQSAEETGKGARSVIEHPLFQEQLPDYCFALHNVPGFEKHTIICKEDTFTPSVISMIIRVQGETSHAAEPEKGKNPTRNIAGIIERVLQLNSDAASEENAFCIVTPIYTRIGSQAYGTSAGEGETHFTIRTYSNKKTDEITEKIQQITEQYLENTGMQATFSFLEEFAANENDSTCVELIKNAATDNKFNYINKPAPFSWGEDFGLFTQKFKGAMFGLGAGKDTSPLHHPDYDFPDTIIQTGVQMFTSLIQKVTNE